MSDEGMFVTGSLEPFRRRLGSVMPRLQIVVNKTALRLERRISDHITSQDFVGSLWEELNPDYLDEKIRKGLSELVRIATGVNLELLGTMSVGDNMYFVGWPRGAVSADGEDLVAIMAVLEFGTERAFGNRTIKPRPVVGPSIDEERPRYEAELRSAMEKIFT